MKLTLKVTFFLFFSASHSFLFSQADSSYYKFLLNAEKEYQNFTDNEWQEYRQFTFEYNKALKFYEDKVQKMWGIRTSGSQKKEVYTEYSDDLKSRMIINFKKGNVVIETIIDDGENEKDKTLKSLKKLIRSKGKYISENIDFQQLTDESLLKNQAKKIDENKLDYKLKTITGRDKKQRKITKLVLKLAPNHIKKRAEIYLPLVQKYAKEYDLKTELVLAIIQTESYFNPKAKSGAPAYGLMQLIPKYAGRASYKYITGNDKIPTPTYLYKPENNIKLGCAYLKILDTKVFGKIKDEKSRLYCVIASYNCGAGRLAQTVVGSKNIRKATLAINGKNSNEILKLLKQNLPGETRKYLPAVLSKSENYRTWLR